LAVLGDHELFQHLATLSRTEQPRPNAPVLRSA
jgi:hypothetical protein